MKRIAILSIGVLVNAGIVFAASAQTRVPPKQQPAFQGYTPTFGQSNKGIGAGVKNPGLPNGVTFAQPMTGAGIISRDSAGILGQNGTNFRNR